eukprot:symbB.v1.2.033976.t4/scaffold4304.1/size41633/1
MACWYIKLCTLLQLGRGLSEAFHLWRPICMFWSTLCTTGLVFLVFTVIFGAGPVAPLLSALVTALLFILWGLGSTAIPGGALRWYLAEEENYKILLLLWPVLLCVGLLAIEILSKWLLNEGPPSLIKKHLLRKSFHLLAICLFAPPLIFGQGQFLALAQLCASLLFIALEDISKDLVLTHLYLLLGCSLPVWLECFLVPVVQSNVRPMAGLLLIGIGDSCAALVGIRFGHRKWPGSHRTLLGTMAFVFSVWSACEPLENCEHLMDSIEYLVFMAIDETTGRELIQDEGNFDVNRLHNWGVHLSDGACGRLLPYVGEEEDAVAEFDFEGLFSESSEKRLLGKFRHKEMRTISAEGDGGPPTVQGFELFVSGLKPHCMHRISVCVRCVVENVPEPDWQRLKLDPSHPLRWSDPFHSSPLLTPLRPPPMLVPELVPIPDGRFGRFLHTPCILLKCAMFAKQNKNDSDKDHSVVVDCRPAGSTDEALFASLSTCLSSRALQIVVAKVQSFDMMKLQSILSLLVVPCIAQPDWCRWVPYASQQYVPDCSGYVYPPQANGLACASWCQWVPGSSWGYVPDCNNCYQVYSGLYKSTPSAPPTNLVKTSSGCEASCQWLSRPSWNSTSECQQCEQPLVPETMPSAVQRAQPRLKVRMQRPDWCKWVPLSSLQYVADCNTGAAAVPAAAVPATNGGCASWCGWSPVSSWQYMSECQQCSSTLPEGQAVVPTAGCEHWCQWVSRPSWQYVGGCVGCEALANQQNEIRP